eukprot:GHVQ01013193.1.p1 GENE.GHVQ01013193.1~~GHVQ01013193.1.p1  ORF type:complete len:1759 (+),score=317.67 GHVQ01013193.1:432-5279(+)
MFVASRVVSQTDGDFGLRRTVEEEDELRRIWTENRTVHLSAREKRKLKDSLNGRTYQIVFIDCNERLDLDFAVAYISQLHARPIRTTVLRVSETLRPPIHPTSSSSHPPPPPTFQTPARRALGHLLTDSQSPASSYEGEGVFASPVLGVYDVTGTFTAYRLVQMDTAGGGVGLVSGGVSVLGGMGGGKRGRRYEVMVLWQCDMSGLGWVDHPMEIRWGGHQKHLLILHANGDVTGVEIFYEEQDKDDMTRMNISPISSGHHLKAIESCVLVSGVVFIWTGDTAQLSEFCPLPAPEINDHTISARHAHGHRHPPHHTKAQPLSSSIDNYSLLLSQLLSAPLSPPHHQQQQMTQPNSHDQQRQQGDVMMPSKSENVCIDSISAMRDVCNPDKRLTEHLRNLIRRQTVNAVWRAEGEGAVGGKGEGGGGDEGDGEKEFDDVRRIHGGMYVWCQNNDGLVLLTVTRKKQELKASEENIEKKEEKIEGQNNITETVGMLNQLDEEKPLLEDTESQQQQQQQQSQQEQREQQQRQLLQPHQQRRQPPLDEHERGEGSVEGPGEDKTISIRHFGPSIAPSHSFYPNFPQLSPPRYDTTITIPDSDGLYAVTSSRHQRSKVEQLSVEKEPVVVITEATNGGGGSGEVSRGERRDDYKRRFRYRQAVLLPVEGKPHPVHIVSVLAEAGVVVGCSLLHLYDSTHPSTPASQLRLQCQPCFHPLIRRLLQVSFYPPPSSHTQTATGSFTLHKGTGTASGSSHDSCRDEAASTLHAENRDRRYMSGYNLAVALCRRFEPSPFFQQCLELILHEALEDAVPFYAARSKHLSTSSLSSLTVPTTKETQPQPSMHASPASFKPNNLTNASPSNFSPHSSTPPYAISDSPPLLTKFVNPQYRYSPRTDPKSCPNTLSIPPSLYRSVVAVGSPGGSCGGIYSPASFTQTRGGDEIRGESGRAGGGGGGEEGLVGRNGILQMCCALYPAFRTLCFCLDLLKVFESCLAEVLIAGIRKTEPLIAPVLVFPLGGLYPERLFLSCLSKGQLQTASLYLLILQNFVGPLRVRSHYVLPLIRRSLVHNCPSLTKSLVNFFKALYVPIPFLLHSPSVGRQLLPSSSPPLSFFPADPTLPPRTVTEDSTAVPRGTLPESEAPVPSTPSTMILPLPCSLELLERFMFPYRTGESQKSVGVPGRCWYSSVGRLWRPCCPGHGSELSAPPVVAADSDGVDRKAAAKAHAALENLVSDVLIECVTRLQWVRLYHIVSVLKLDLPKWLEPFKQQIRASCSFSSIAAGDADRPSGGGEDLHHHHEKPSIDTSTKSQVSQGTQLPASCTEPTTATAVTSTSNGLIAVDAEVTSTAALSHSVSCRVVQTKEKSRSYGCRFHKVVASMEYQFQTADSFTSVPAPFEDSRRTTMPVPADRPSPADVLEAITLLHSCKDTMSAVSVPVSTSLSDAIICYNNTGSVDLTRRDSVRTHDDAGQLGKPPQHSSSSAGIWRHEEFLTRDSKREGWLCSRGGKRISGYCLLDKDSELILVFFLRVFLILDLGTLALCAALSLNSGTVVRGLLMTQPELRENVVKVLRRLMGDEIFDSESARSGSFSGSTTRANRDSRQLAHVFGKLVRLVNEVSCD